MHKKTIAFFAIFAALFLTAEGMGEIPETSSPKKERLIRIDLLTRTRPDMTSPGRNLFMPSSSYSSYEAISGEDRPLEGTMEETMDTENGLSSSSEFELRYFGYVLSGKEIVALITFDDDVFAVKIGDIITSSVQVLRITPEEITVAMDDSSSKSFAIEGDRP